MRFRGFTLLEVLVALSIFAVAAVVLGSTYVNVLNAYHTVNRVDTYENEIRFARAQLMAEPDRTKAEQGDDFATASGGHVTWRAKIETSAIANVFAVTFTCEVPESNSAARTEPITETFMLLRPTWSAGIDTTKQQQETKDRILELKRKRT